ncbi:MAG: TIGR02147 family protein [Myxococcota bacterium]
MNLPSVYSYLDFRAFLRDWFEARKRADPAYSHAGFARDAGCSKGTLANVVAGARTPRTDTLDAFARAMELGPSERNYLGLLVDFATANDLASRREALEKLLSSEQYRRLRFAESERDPDVFRYLEHWYVPAIREMAGSASFRPDPAWIAAVLQPRIRVEEAAHALETLLELGYLCREDDGRVTQREIRFRTAAETQQVAAAHFHREALPNLMRGLDTEQASEQHLVAMTLTLHPSMLPEVKARLNALVEQLATQADDPLPEAGRRVYQLAVQLLPLSDALS